MTVTEAPYGEWSTPLDTRDVFARPGNPQFPQVIDGTLYWRRRDDGSHEHVTPEGFNIRTRVHEYGGRCHVIATDEYWFINFADQRLYRQDLAGGVPEAVAGGVDENVAEDSRWMMADLAFHPSGRWIVAVGERSTKSGENENAIVAVDLQSDEGRIHRIVSGDDFYATPVISPDGARLAWVSWNHPSMPWDATTLNVADFTTDTATLSDVRLVDGGSNACVCQPIFTPAGDLVYARDSDGAQAPDDFWNLFSHKGATSTRMTADQAEYGAPHWVFGYRRVAAAANGNVLAVSTSAAGEALTLIKPDGERILPADKTDFTNFDQLSVSNEGEVTLVAQSAFQSPSVVAVNMDSGELRELIPGSALLQANDVSAARAFVADTRDGDKTHAWSYAPRNSAFTGPADARPPLMVLVHGGPTGRASAAFDPLRQFWTTRGFAVLDINHRGSTGYGRQYRQALNGLWGVRDVDDIVDTISAFVDQGHADANRVFIRGGSAGGFSVLAALTRYPDTFTAGACYYGIGNLVTLAMTTHKFEARYLDTLLGQPWSPELKDDESSVYYERSPIHRMHQVKAPMILFQGSEDKVVPPEVSREVVEVLKREGVEHRYIEYPGEGHGFRSSQNRINALESEASFFANVMDDAIG